MWQHRRSEATGGAQFLKVSSVRWLVEFFYMESLSCSIGSSGRLEDRVKNKCEWRAGRVSANMKRGSVIFVFAWLHDRVFMCMFCTSCWKGLPQRARPKHWQHLFPHSLFSEQPGRTDPLIHCKPSHSASTDLQNPHTYRLVVLSCKHHTDVDPVLIPISCPEATYRLQNNQKIKNTTLNKVLVLLTLYLYDSLQGADSVSAGLLE